MVRDQQPLSYWQGLPTWRLLEDYAVPHAAKCEDEGLHVRAIVIQELARRLAAIDPTVKA